MNKTTWIALLAMLSATGTMAETSPWYVGVQQTFTHDNNLYRVGEGLVLPDGTARGDTISSTALVAGLDQQISRQRLRGSLNLSDNRYSHNSNLNTPSHNGSLALDWATAERLSGTLSLASTKSQMQFNALGTSGLAETRKNVVSSQQIDGLARVGAVTQLTAEIGAGHSSQSYSAIEYQARQYRQDYASLGLTWRPSGLLTLGTALRETQGRYPKFRDLGQGQFSADRFTRQDIDLTAQWLPSQISQVSGRLSATRNHYDLNSLRNASGLTGNINWDWQPTGKMHVRSTLWRDFSQRSEPSTFAIFGAGYTDYSSSTNGARVLVEQELSGKVSVNASLAQARRSLVDTLSVSQGLLGTGSGQDRTMTTALGLRWNPTRNSTVGCDIGREQRRSDGRLSTNMSGSTYGCSGQLTLQ